ncbi:MAG TPA: T9SS type A sorting domain-containing protein, partial [Saprospiraceae bacterium]|nr:T9SS type A sorting domain-containing protein [Saprospiraceae bacterium]
ESIQDGSYAFKSLYPNTEYVVRPTRNDNPLNGVSTADIVKIQKHILGKELLQTPYKIIAADVNGTHSVTAADISEIRKLILGVQPEFRNAPSWKFIPASTRFEDVTAPWGYPVEEKIRMGQISQKVDFTAVKMGDVTDNADPGLNGYSTIRTTETLDILVEDRQFEAGEVIAIPFYAGSLVSLEGMQFTVNYNSSTMFFDRIESGLLSLTPANLGVFDPSVGKLTLSWNEDQPALTQTGKPLFTLYFKTVTGSSLQNNLLISSDITMSEYYLSSGIEGKVQLKLLKGDLSLPAEMFEVISVSPNPFKDQTEVHFRLPEGAVLRSTVYDVTGKVVRMYTHTEDYKNNVLRIRRTDLNGPGMYYLQMDADHQTRTIKIIAVQ